jgi:aconitate hydratase
MVPKISRCTVDMLRQILYDKTQDVGKNDFDTIQQGSKLKLRGIKKLLEKRTIEIPVEVEGKTIITILDISDRQYNYLIAGGALNFVKEELQG